MTTRRDVEVLADAGRGVVALARRDLSRFWGEFSGRNPEAFRDALLEYIPELVRTYGDIAGSVAADWYEDVRSAQVGGGFRAVIGSAVPVAAVQGSVRYAAGALFTDAPEKGLATLAGSLQQYVLHTSRDTIATNVARDPARPQFARIPSGAKTCAFCTLLGSRGFVYHSRERAGEFDHYHNDCDCQIVAEWDENPSIEGYDPDRMYGMYSAARDASGVSDLKGIAAQMREMFPDEFTDGHVSK